MIRLGIVGYGWVARDYALPAINSCPALELVSIADPKAHLPSHGVVHYHEVEDMLSSEGLDAVYVATPNHAHCEHTLLALEAGCHVLCEKPLALTKRDADEMMRQAYICDRHLVCAFDQRHHPAHLAMRELIGEGQIGTVTQVRIDYACWVGTDFMADNWRVKKGLAGGGAVIDLAPHGIDLVEHLTGERFSDLTVSMQRRVHDYEVDDGGVLIGRTRNGVLASLTVAYNRRETLPRRRLEVWGTEGGLVAENTMGQTAGGSVVHHAADGSSRTVPFEARPPFDGQFHAFADVCHGETPLRQPEDDVRLVGLLEGALERRDAWP